jgi:hypothetical protein
MAIYKMELHPDHLVEVSVFQMIDYKRMNLTQCLSVGIDKER